MKMKEKKARMPMAKSRHELAKDFGVSYTTLYRWLKRHSIHLPPGLVTPQYIEKIYLELGFPLPEEYQPEVIESED